jgi:hypothetical protein
VLGRDDSKMLSGLPRDHARAQDAGQGARRARAGAEPTQPCAVEQRTDKRQQLSNLRDSGTIEQDADVVMFVDRDEYYLERNGGADPAARNAAAGRAEILVVKQRHGPTGMANLLFDGATTHFSDDPARGRAEAA